MPLLGIKAAFTVGGVITTCKEGRYYSANKYSTDSSTDFKLSSTFQCYIFNGSEVFIIPVAYLT